MADARELFNKNGVLLYLRGVFLRQVVSALLIFAVGTALLPRFMYSWAVGCLVAVVDVVLVLSAVFRTMQTEPKAGLSVMRKSMLKRLVLVVAVSLVMLKMGLNPIGVFISFILMHISLVLNLIILTSRAQRDK